MPERKAGITKDSPIAVVEMPGTGHVYGRLRLTRALPTITGILAEAGHTNVTGIDPQYNTLMFDKFYTNKLNRKDKEAIDESQVLCMPLLTPTAPVSETVASEYMQNHPDGWVVLGGPHASLAAEECLKWDKRPNKRIIIVRGEGEKTLPKVLEALEENGSPRGVEGVSYYEGNEIKHEPDRELLTEEELSRSPRPIYSEAMLKGSHARLIWMGRGCPHACDFCTVTAMNGFCYRMKSETVVNAEYEEAYYSDSMDKMIFYIDDNFAGNPKRTEALLRRNIEMGMTRRPLVTQLRAEIGLRKGFPDLLRQAGVLVVPVGAETLFDDNLKEINKGMSAKTTMEGIMALKEAGLWVHAMFIVGLDEDTLDTLDYTLEWAKKYATTAQFVPPGPLPGTGFTRRMEEEDRIITKNYSLYHGDYVVVRPKKISPYDLQMKIFEMYKDFYDPRRMHNPVEAIKSRLADSSSMEWRAFKRDFAVRMYAWHTLGGIASDHRTRQHLRDLKAAA